METTLVVVRPFGPHAVGDRISAPDSVAATLASEHAGAVVAITMPAAKAPAQAGEH